MMEPISNIKNTKAKSKKAWIAGVIVILVFGGIAFAAYLNPGLFQANIFSRTSFSRSLIRVQSINKSLLNSVDTSCVGVACPAGFACQKGLCADQSCVGVACPAGFVCQQGLCADQSCVGVVCPAGLTCQQGACADLRCTGVICPQGYECKEGTCASLAVCGNGIKEAPEACDDGDVTNQGTCNATCSAPNFCGDAVKQANEQCDDGNSVTESCAYGQQSCQVCNASCNTVAGAVVGRCGDTVIQFANGEVCDGSNVNNQKCASGKGTLKCGVGCQVFDTSSCK